MKRRDFLKSVAIAPVVGLAGVGAVAQPNPAENMAKGFLPMFSPPREQYINRRVIPTKPGLEPRFHLCKPLIKGQLPESVESIGCKTALKDLKETIGCFQTPHVLDVTCPECCRRMSTTWDAIPVVQDDDALCRVNIMSKP